MQLGATQDRGWAQGCVGVLCIVSCPPGPDPSGCEQAPSLALEASSAINDGFEWWFVSHPFLSIYCHAETNKLISVTFNRERLPKQKRDFSLPSISDLHWLHGEGWTRTTDPHNSSSASQGKHSPLFSPRHLCPSPSLSVLKALQNPALGPPVSDPCFLPNVKGLMCNLCCAFTSTKKIAFQRWDRYLITRKWVTAKWQ